VLAIEGLEVTTSKQKFKIKLGMDFLIAFIRSLANPS